MKAKQEKYIDLNQFPHDKSGKIMWGNSIGVVAEFFYNGKRHELEILERINKDYFKIRVDDILFEKAHTTKITGLMFSDVFYAPNYLYCVGDVVNNLLILEQLQVQHKTKKGRGLTNRKAYYVKCVNDEYEFVITEYGLKCGNGCPVCSNTKIIKGVNDIATTDPELVGFFVNKGDAYTHSRSSDSKVLVKCPYCGFEKMMRIAELSKYGYVTCDKCSDGISYPNKFAHELFSQLSKQYKFYQFEYRPSWAGLYRYDNYVELLNGNKLIIEMDGGRHYNSNEPVYQNDKKKDLLCNEHGIRIIRVDCNYVKTYERYNYIKNNVIKTLSPYFDLSNMDWDKCNESGLSNFLFNVVKYYNENPKLGLEDIASHFGICMGTMYSYMYMGESLGLCTYIRADAKRIKNSKPVSMYKMDGTLIGVFKSAKVIQETFPEKEFRHRNIRSYIYKNKPYKGYIFKFATFKEYQEFDENTLQDNVA